MPNWRITATSAEGEIDMIAEGDWEDVTDYVECLKEEGAHDVKVVESHDPIPASHEDTTITLLPPQKLYRRDGQDIPQ